MTPSPLASEEERSFLPFTKAERIQQLNDIDKSVTTLLHSAGLALQTLTASQSSATSLSRKREIFENTSEAYLKTLHSVDVHLRRQIYGLEEANIIPPLLTKPKLSEQSAYNNSAGMGQPARDPEERRVAEERRKVVELNRLEGNLNLALKEGGMGKLDTGWLNTRSAKVERDMEAEVWKKTRKYMEGVEGMGTNKETRIGGNGENGQDDDMSG